MNLKLAKGAFAPSQAYICLPCRLHNVYRSSFHSPRYQHVAASQAGGTTSESPIASPNSNNNDGLSGSAALSTDQPHHPSPGTGTTGLNQGPTTDAASASPQATKLQQVLQRQFAEKRRVKMAKTGLRAAPQSLVVGKKGLVKPKISSPVDEQKVTRSGRVRRFKGRSPTPQKVPSQTEAKAVTRTLHELLDLNQAPEGGVPGPPKIDPFVKLHADVQKLKKVLETEDKVKRTTKIQLSKMEKPKGPGDASATQKKPKIKAPEQFSIRKCEGNVKDAGSSWRSTSDAAPLRAVQTITGSASNLLKGVTSLKDRLVRNVESAVKTKTPKIPDRKSLNVPSRTGSGKDTVIEVVNAEGLNISAIEIDQPPVPHLSYGLERVLFNPGVYHLQDPRSRVYNFDPYLQKIMPVTEFDFSALKAYVTSSGDEALRQIAESHGKRYVGSTSSMTSILAHFHFLLSQWREIGTSMLSNEFPKSSSKKFTLIQKAPTAVFLRWRDGTYAIDADKQYANANVLMMLGKSMEKLLTLKKDDFEKYRRSSGQEVPPEERNAPESYHYSTMGDFLMRSQLDAFDARLPGTGMFDLKTRAVVSVRMDTQKVERGMGYEIKTRQGAWESYEREYYDMIRSAMLKYSLQVRMGRMDGIFVAYHNTQRIFGFQYISLAEMDAALHGQWDITLGDQQFKLSLDLLNKVLDRATKRYPKQSLRIHFETRDAQTPFMYIFAEPVTEEQIQAVQSENDAEIAEYERKVLGLHKDIASQPQQDDDGKWADMQADVEKEMDKDEVSLSNPDIDGITSSVETEEAEVGDDETEVLDKGPLWESARAQNFDDEPIAAGVEDEDKEDHDSESDGLAKSGEEDLVDDSQEFEENPERFIANGDAVEDDGDIQGGDEHPGENQIGDGNGEMPTDVETAEDTESTGTDAPEYPHRATQSPKSGSWHDEEQVGTRSNQDIGSEADASFLDSAAKAEPVLTNAQDVLAMTLTIRNRVNDSYVLRPENLSASDRWSVEYAMAEVGDRGKAWSLYQASRLRRERAMEKNEDDDENKRLDWYMRNLRELSEKGEKWRQEQDERDKDRPTVVLGRSSAAGELFDEEESPSKT